MLQNHSRAKILINDHVKHCDVCADKISEGDLLFVGVIDNGTLVCVSNCCRSSLHSVFSQSQYWCPPEEPCY